MYSESILKMYVLSPWNRIGRQFVTVKFSEKRRMSCEIFFGQAGVPDTRIVTLDQMPSNSSAQSPQRWQILLCIGSNCLLFFVEHIEKCNSNDLVQHRVVKCFILWTCDLLETRQAKH